MTIETNTNELADIRALSVEEMDAVSGGFSPFTIGRGFGSLLATAALLPMVAQIGFTVGVASAVVRTVSSVATQTWRTISSWF